MEGYVAFIDVVRKALFWVGLAAAIIALVDWLVRTRRINPFGRVAQFFRRVVDPMMRPIEHRIVRAGGLPNSAPWWTLVVVVVGGLVLIWLLQFIGALAAQVSYAANTPGAAWRVLVSWAFGLIRLALIMRVIASWFALSPYAWYIRWTYTLTEWMLGPLRRMLPTFGPIDISPIIMFLLLGLIQSAIL